MQMDMRSGRLSIPGLYNARDLGAMTNADGKALACHRLIRSDALDHLDEESIRLLSEYPTDVIIDLRSEEEAQNHPDTVYSDPRFTYYNIPLLRVNADDINAGVITDTISTSLGHLYIWMLENSIYAILSPEGYASILWKDAKRAEEAASKKAEEESKAEKNA